MKQYVSLDKRSKKAQKEYHAKQRRTWGELNPVTRSVPSGKVYNRKKKSRESVLNPEMGLMPILIFKERGGKSHYSVTFDTCVD